MTVLTLDDANAIIAGALAEGRVRCLKPLTVVVTDPGGHLVACQREDGASLLRPKIALGKASGALALGIPSSAIAKMAAERPSFVTSLTGLIETGIVPAAGGLIIVNEVGAILGAVGISGDTPDNDESCARSGIDAARLIAAA